MVNPNVDKVLFNDEPGTVGRQLSEENLGARNKRGNSSDYVEKGLSFDYANNQLDISEGHVVISDDRGFAYDALPVARSDLALTDNDVTEVYCVIDPGLGDHIEYQLITDGSTPSNAHLKVGEVDTSAGTSTELNRAPAASFQSTTTERIDNGRVNKARNHSNPTKVANIIDDGEIEVWDWAYPELDEYGHTGTIGVISGSVGTEGYMSKEQLTHLWENGWELANHGKDQQPLTGKTDAEIMADWEHCNALISDITGEDPDGVYFHSNAYDSHIVEMARTYFEWIRGDVTDDLPGIFPKHLPEMFRGEALGIDTRLIDRPEAFGNSLYPLTGDQQHHEPRSYWESTSKAAFENGVQLVPVSALAPYQNILPRVERKASNFGLWGSQTNTFVDTGTTYYFNDEVVKLDTGGGSTPEAATHTFKRFCPIWSGESYTINAALKTSITQGTVDLNINWYDQNNSFIQTDTATTLSSNTSGFERTGGSVTAPSNAVTCKPEYEITNVLGQVWVQDIHLLGPIA